MDNNRIIREILMNIMMERIIERVKVSQMKAKKITSRKVKNQVIMARLTWKTIKMIQIYLYTQAIIFTLIIKLKMSMKAKKTKVIR